MLARSVALPSRLCTKLVQSSPARVYPRPLTCSQVSNTSPQMALVDIGANLVDEMFQGVYGGKRHHPPDLPAVLQRAWDAGLGRIVVTAGTLAEAREALALAASDSRLFCTAGVHPTRCGEIAAHPAGAEDYLRQLRGVVREGRAAGKLAALGECGLDYARLHFCDAPTQQRFFRAQLELGAEERLPMFLHLRDAAQDFVPLLREFVGRLPSAIVHSFDGSREELDALMSLGPNVFIGLNGCSLKTEANLGVAAAVPRDRLLLETDAPYCELRPSHASRRHISAAPPPPWGPPRDKRKWEAGACVKGRHEPCGLVQVFEAVAGCRGVEDREAFARALEENSRRAFGWEARC